MGYNYLFIIKKKSNELEITEFRVFTIETLEGVPLKSGKG